MTPPTPAPERARRAPTGPEAPPACGDCACRAECLIGRLPEAQYQQIQPLFRERHIGPREPLLRQGESNGLLSLVKVGQLLVTRRGADARERPVGIFGCGTAIGAFGMLGEPSPLGLQAITPLRLCELRLEGLPPALLRELVATPQFAQLSLRAYDRLADWAEVVRVQGITGQVAAALLLLGKSQRSRLVRLPPHSVLGALLGTTRESIARALARLERQGHLLRRDRRHCELFEQQLRACVGATPLPPI